MGKATIKHQSPSERLKNAIKVNAEISVSDMANISPEVLVEILQENGSTGFTMAILKDDIANGAPVNDDGTMSLWDYGAWLFNKNKGYRP